MTKNFYDLVPAQRRTCRERDDGTVEVLVPRYGKGIFGRVLAKFLNNRPVGVTLDDIGTNVWRLCDGRRSVYEIGREMHGRFGDRIEPVYERLETFLTQMHRAELIDWKD